MKVITSIDEWLEAARADRLIRLNPSFEWVKSCFSGDAFPAVRLETLINDIDAKLYAIAPEEVKLVECKTNHPDFPVVYVPQDMVTLPSGTKTTYSSSPVRDGRLKLDIDHDRTLTGVIDSE